MSLYYHRNIIPDNIVEASFRQTQTKYTYEIEKAPLSETLLNVTHQNASTNQNMTTGQVIRKLSKSLGKTDSPNMLGKILK